MKWYADGLRFECQMCGQCCAGPTEGYVYPTHAEITTAARHLAVTIPTFRLLYTHRLGNRTVFNDANELSGRCAFLCINKECRIHPARPVQCRAWPFWPANLRSPAAWEHAKKRCQGIGRGRLFTRKEIDTRRRLAEPLFT